MYVKVKFLRKNGEYYEKEYSYKTKLRLKCGDKVLAPAFVGNVSAVVSEVNVPKSDIDSRIVDNLREITEYDGGDAE